MKKILATAMAAMLAGSAGAAVLISQYYEGTSNNKWIELKNTSSSPVNLSSYYLTVWSNANAENYKSDSNTPTYNMNLSGTLGGGGVYLLSNPSAVLPSYATANATNANVIGFNGNDSVVLYNGNTWAVATIVDAIGFTNTGNEGADKSFVRISSSPGWNTVIGSNATSFSTVWSQVSNATVDSAASNQEAYLGFSSIPEPGTLALLGGFGALLAIRRRLRK